MSDKSKRKDKEMNKILPVRYVSQNSKEVPDKWKDLACGIAGAKMIIDFLTNSNVDIKHLIEEGEILKGFIKEGWLHDTLVKLMRNHGVLAYSQEYRSVKVLIDKIHGVTFTDFVDDQRIRIRACEKFIKKIDENLPIILSVGPKFNNNKHTHLIVLTGHAIVDEKRVFYYHDPDSRNGVEKINESIFEDDLFKYWRRFVIYSDGSIG